MEKIAFTHSATKEEIAAAMAGKIIDIEMSQGRAKLLIYMLRRVMPGSQGFSFEAEVLRNAELDGAFKGWIGFDGAGELREPIR